MDVLILNSKEVLFEGRAKSLILPGEAGVFEIMPYHKDIVSRLVSGILFLDNEEIPIKRGIVQAHKNKVTVIVEDG